MTEPVKPRRRYDSTRRQEEARKTRRAILAAARDSFLDLGYAKTTIAAVAREASVSVETIYKAFGSKPRLAKAVFDVAIVGDDEPIPMLQREMVVRIEAEPDPRRKFLIYGEHLATAGPRAGELQLVLRDAAATDPEVARLWESMLEERLLGMSAFARHLFEGGHLRDEITFETARDVLWTYNSVEMYDLLVLKRGWEPDVFGRWIAEAMIAALLP
jgi:AcrR family transcriptional regulator